MIDLHAGDVVLSRVLSHFPGIYSAPAMVAEELLAAFLKPKLDGLRPRRNETARAYRLRFMAVFTGVQWALARKKIANAFTAANIRATEYINGSLEEAFADGLNDAAYTLARSGVEAWPISAAMVPRLGIELGRRGVKRGRDSAYNARRLQTAVHSAVFQGVSADDLPKHVARVMSGVRKREMTAAARATIYGASDYGEYLAGIEAERSGIDIEKTWLAIMDMHVRPSHKHLHGVTIPLHALFHGYRGDLRFPHDPKAHPGEINNCRCRMVVHVKGKSPGQYSRKLLPSQTAAYKKWREAQIRKAGSELELMKLHKRLMGK